MSPILAAFLAQFRQANNEKYGQTGEGKQDLLSLSSAFLSIHFLSHHQFPLELAPLEDIRIVSKDWPSLEKRWKVSVALPSSLQVLGQPVHVCTQGGKGVITCQIHGHDASNDPDTAK